MGGEQAAVGAGNRQARRHRRPRRPNGARKKKPQFKQPIRDQYEHQGHPYYASARLWDDGVIDPRRHPHRAGLGLSAAHECSRSATRGSACSGCEEKDHET
jgi:3-methylcrotonyl-CoA carboxylase beta subunit